MNLKDLKEQLIQHEDIRNFPYKCTAGRLTIGVGRNLQDVGISFPEAMYLLDNDITDVICDLKKIFIGFKNFPENIQLVLADMRFNLGADGFRKFKRLISAASIKDWQGVKEGMIFSLWYKQVGERSANLVKMVDEVIQNEHT